MKNTNTKKKNVTGSSRSGEPTITLAENRITVFSSRGAAQATSDLGNRFFTMDIPGNPWDGSLDGCHTLIDVQIDLSRYFAASVFNSYDRYRMSECETTFYWKSGPNRGPILGELYFALDQDSREAENLIQIANRTALQTRAFDNSHTRQVITWKPYLVEDTSTFDVVGRQVDYTQNRMRWLNTAQVRNHRFGTLRGVAQCHDKPAYDSIDPAIGMRHRITLEMSGQRTVQA